MMDTVEKHLIFQVKDQFFTVDVTYVSAIIQIPKIFKVPQAPDYILGIINVEGDVIPIIDTGLKLNMGEIERHKRSQVIIMQKKETDNGSFRKLGFLVTDIDDVAEVSPLKMQPLPTSKYHFDERLVDGIHKVRGEFCMQVNVKNFYTEDFQLTI